MYGLRIFLRCWGGISSIATITLSFCSSCCWYRWIEHTPPLPVSILSCVHCRKENKVFSNQASHLLMFLYAQNGIIFKGCSTYSSFWSLYIHLQFHSPIAYILLYMVLRSGKNRMLGDGGAVCYPLILPNPVIQGCPAWGGL